MVKTIKRDQERIEAVSNNNGQYTTLSSADNDVKSVSQDPIGIRVQGKVRPQKFILVFLIASFCFRDSWPLGRRRW